jgi:hypothetical protein
MPRQKSRPIQKKRGRDVETTVINDDSDNSDDDNNGIYHVMDKLLDYDFDEIVEEDGNDENEVQGQQKQKTNKKRQNKNSQKHKKMYTIVAIEKSSACMYV